MSRRREIRFSRQCDESIVRLGGHEFLEEAVNAIYDPLSRDPYQCSIIQTDWTFAARYIITEQINTIPRLVWYFTIRQDGSVDVEEVETLDEY